MLWDCKDSRAKCHIRSIKRTCGEKDKNPVKGAKSGKKGGKTVKGVNIPMGVGDKNCSCWEDYLNYWTPDSERYERSKDEETGTEKVCEKRECKTTVIRPKCRKCKRCKKVSPESCLRYKYSKCPKKGVKRQPREKKRRGRAG